MEKKQYQKLDETLQETLLRATFQQHAPSAIDLEQGWEKISTKLDSSRRQVSFLHLSPLFLAKFPQKRRFLERPRMLAATVAFLALIAAIIVLPLSGWLNGDQIAYAQVNQSRRDQGIDVTLIKAYASNSGTLLEVMIHAEHSAVVMVSTLKYRQEILTFPGSTGGGNLNTNVSCELFEASTAHPPTDAQTITLIWQVHQLLFHESVSLLPTPQKHGTPPWMIQGNWTFQFTIPFHHDDSKPANADRFDSSCG